MDMQISSLAARVTFSQLFDAKRDIYSVIIEYVIYVIRNMGVTFSAHDITQEINTRFDFNLPEAVVKTAIKKFLLKYDNKYGITLSKHGDYSVINSTPSSQNIFCESSLNEVEQHLLLPLCRYIEEAEDVQVDQSTKREIENAFCNYLIEESYSGKYANYISGFIIKNEHNKKIAQLINDIKDGSVLEVGLRYQGQASIVNQIRRPLMLFLDTEILFSAFGLNGEIYRNLFDCFYQQIKEINTQILKANRKSTVTLCYFQEQKDEIQTFFNAASKSLETHSFDPFPKEAMKNILKQCETPADVVALESKFFHTLWVLGIILWEEPINMQANDEFNLAYRDNIRDVLINYRIDKEEAYSHLAILTKINILRKGINNASIEDVRYMLVTGKANRFRISAALSASLGKCYLASTIEWLTNYFWFRLNKGLGKERPLTLNAFATAKRLLAANLDGVVGKLYQQYKNSNLTDSIEENLAIVAELRRKSYNPDQIDETVVTDILDTLIHEKDLSEIIREQKQKDEELKHYREKEKRKKNITTIIVNSIAVVACGVFSLISGAWISMFFLKYKELFEVLVQPYAVFIASASLFTLVATSHKHITQLLKSIFQMFK